jgi:hypothetical protein
LALPNGITLGQAISDTDTDTDTDTDNQLITLFKYLFLLNEASFRKLDLLKLII